MHCSITYFGTATLLLQIGDIRILTDPAFGPKGTTDHVLGWVHYRKLYDSNLNLDQFRGLDAVLITHHHHADNLDEKGLETARSAKTIITTVAGAAAIGGKAEGLLPWQSTVLHSENGQSVKITATPAQHGPSWLNWLTGPVIGFVLEWPGQTQGALYISGDTVFFSGITDVAKRFQIRTAILHFGRASFAMTGPLQYSFSARDGLRAFNTLSAKTCIPVHYEGWSHFKEGRLEIETAFEKEGKKDRLRWLEPEKSAPLESGESPEESPL